MLAEGLIDENHFWGTVNCDGISPKGEIGGCDHNQRNFHGRSRAEPATPPFWVPASTWINEVGAAGSTGRGEANLYNLTSFLIVENMRRGMHPKDAGMEGLKRIKANTVEKRLLNSRGEPAFNIRFFILNAKGEYAGVTMYASGETTYGLCTENGAETPDFEALLSGSPTD